MGKNIYNSKKWFGHTSYVCLANEPGFARSALAIADENRPGPPLQFSCVEVVKQVG